VVFGHITVPLTWSRRAQGLGPAEAGLGSLGERENVRRHAFNEKLRASYPRADLRLAQIEATRADGALDTYLFDGKAVRSCARISATTAATSTRRSAGGAMGSSATSPRSRRGAP